MLFLIHKYFTIQHFTIQRGKRSIGKRMALEQISDQEAEMVLRQLIQEYEAALRDY